MDEMSKDIKQIKLLIGIGALALLSGVPMGLVQTYIMYKSYKPVMDYQPAGYYKAENQEFSNKAQDLLAAGKYQDLTKLAMDQTSQRPTDPYGYYYLGLADYYEGNYQGVLNNFQKVDELAPNWDKSVTKPFIEKAQAKLDEKK